MWKNFLSDSNEGKLLKAGAEMNFHVLGTTGCGIGLRAWVLALGAWGLGLGSLGLGGLGLGGLGLGTWAWSAQSNNHI